MNDREAFIVHYKSIFIVVLTVTAADTVTAALGKEGSCRAGDFNIYNRCSYNITGEVCLVVVLLYQVLFCFYVCFFIALRASCGKGNYGAEFSHGLSWENDLRSREISLTVRMHFFD